MLDLHAAPGGQSKLFTADPGGAQTLWQAEQNQNATVELWRRLAARYKNRTIVAGYDLLNEPTPPTGADLAKLYARVIRAVRESDPQHLLFLEGGKLATDFSMFAQPSAENICYSFHIYTWFGDDRKKLLAKYLALAKSQNAPLWCGEFGENNYEMIASTVKMFEQHEEICGWSFWTWKKASMRSPGLVTVKVPADWAGVMKWIGNPLFNAKPASEKASRGIEDFLEAVKFPRAELDAKMLKALQDK